MLNFYSNRFFKILVNIEVVSPEFFKNSYPYGTILTSEFIDCEKFRKLFKKDMWNYIRYTPEFIDMVDTHPPYTFIFNEAWITNEIKDIIVDNLLLDSKISSEINIPRRTISDTYTLEYSDKVICFITFKLKTGDFIKSKQPVLCTKQYYKNNQKTIEIYSLNKVIDDITICENLYSVEKNYGYEIKELDSGITYKIILNPLVFNDGLNILESE